MKSKPHQQSTAVADANSIGGTAHVPVTVILPVLDEELHIRRAVSSALPLGPVFVVDCGSTDRTRDIAAEVGAAVVEHDWEGYAAQKNWALTTLPLDTEWVLFLDADEYVTSGLQREIQAAIQQDGFDGYYIPRRNIFLGRDLRHVWWYPDYQLRLFRNGKGRFEDRLVHEHVLLDGPSTFLRHPLMHENLKGVDAFMRRHERYAALEAQEIRQMRLGLPTNQRRGRLLGSWPERRRWLKLNVWYRLPGRPAIRFLWLYFLRRGFLDGRAGLVYAQLLAAYEALIDAKLLEGEMQVRHAPSTPVDLRSLLICPACHGTLTWSEGATRCDACTRVYPVVDGIAVLLVDQAAAEHDELDHPHGHDHKLQQAAFFDREEAAEFETVRPHGTPGLYRWFLGEKFRRSVRGLRPLTPGETALTVCGGSGMDAEFLALTGLRVIASDISLGAARRTCERANRYGLAIMPLVADVERLPFADRSIDVVYVHDGLHHLERPGAGLAEMARVASRAVSVTEPARAAVTALAVRLGLAFEVEEAGNRVVRLTPGEISEELRAAGLQPVHEERYAMYYPHEPGRIFTVLSLPLLFPLLRTGWRVANRLIGRWGNKVTVQAVREC